MTHIKVGIGMITILIALVHFNSSSQPAPARVPSNILAELLSLCCNSYDVSLSVKRQGGLLDAYNETIGLIAI